MARLRSGGGAGFFAEEITRNEGLQPFAQARLDLVVDRRLAARAAGPIGAEELLVQPCAFGFDEGDDLRKKARRIQGPSACGLRDTGAWWAEAPDARRGGGS